MFLRIWLVISYKFGPQKLCRDGLCQASSVLGRRQFFQNGLTQLEEILENTTWSLSLIWTRHQTWRTQGEAKSVLAFQLTYFLRAKCQERYHENARLQVEVANLGPV